MRHKPHTVWRHLQAAVTKADAIIVVPLTYTHLLPLSLSATLIRHVVQRVGFVLLFDCHGRWAESLSSHE